MNIKLIGIKLHLVSLFAPILLVIVAVPVQAAEDDAYKVLSACRQTRLDNGENSLEYQQCLLENSFNVYEDEFKDSCDINSRSEILTHFNLDKLRCGISTLENLAQTEVSNWCENNQEKSTMNVTQTG